MVMRRWMDGVCNFMPDGSIKPEVGGEPMDRLSPTPWNGLYSRAAKDIFPLFIASFAMQLDVSSLHPYT